MEGKFKDLLLLAQIPTRKHKMKRKFTFKHYSDRKHQSRDQQEWLQQKKFLKYLARTQTSIRNLWGEVQSVVQRRRPHSLAHLVHFCK